MNPVKPAQAWNTTLYEQNHAFVWQFGEDLLNLLAPQAGETILDLGCGTGQLTSQIAEAGATVIGIDRSTEMVQQAATNYPEITFQVADARDFQVDRPLDAVFSNAVLHWIPEADAVIRSIHAALKPNGRFVAELGGKGNVQKIATALQRAFAEQGLTPPSFPWYFPSISDYTTRLEQQGFEVQYAILFDRPTELTAGEAGLANWLEMFAGGMLRALSPDQMQQVVRSIEMQLRESLYQNGHWIADYRRLRIQAYRRD